jgi:hypothetical protein
MASSRSRLTSSPVLAVLVALTPIGCGPEPEPAAPAPQPAPTAVATAAPVQAPAPVASSAPTVAPAATSAPTAEPAATATASAAAPSPKGTSYRVCHCCCGGSEAKKQCLYRSKGESLAKIIEGDKKWDHKCPPNAGCRQPIEYMMCD